MDTDYGIRTSLSEIRDQYREGELDEVENDLKSFLRERRDEIRKIRESLTEKFPNKEIDLGFAAKVYILQIRSINPEYEIKKEMNAIEQEIRRKQEASDENLQREEIVKQWCDRYAPSWRDRHVMSVVFVLEQNMEEFIPLLEEESDPEE